MLKGEVQEAEETTAGTPSLVLVGEEGGVLWQKSVARWRN